jgi:G6PDH family F420-dependent oxidoreductase
MLAEAIEIIRLLHTGELVDHHGDYYDVASARIWDLPDEGVEIAVAVGGEQAIDLLAPLADHLVATEPSRELVEAWNSTLGAPQVGTAARAVGQIPICWDPDRQAAVERAHEQFRWFAGGWSVNADLPTTAGFAGASQFVRPEDVAEQIPCGPDLDAVVEAVRPYWEAGFTDIALVQIGGDHQDAFLESCAEPLLTKLRDAAP